MSEVVSLYSAYLLEPEFKQREQLLKLIVEFTICPQKTVKCILNQKILAKRSEFLRVNTYICLAILKVYACYMTHNI